MALLMSGCTLVGGVAGAGVTNAHNRSGESEEKWSYVAPVVIGTVIGLVIDMLLLRALGKGLGSLANQ